MIVHSHKIALSLIFVLTFATGSGLGDSHDMSTTGHGMAEYQGMIQCVALQLSNGEEVQYGAGCSNQNNHVTDCIVLDVPGSSQRFDGVGRPVITSEPMRVGVDCRNDSPPSRLAGVKPTIVDQTKPWNDDYPNSDREFVAELMLGSGHTIDSVYLKQTRHFWPGAELATTHLPAKHEDNIFKVVPPRNESWVKADHVFYEWHVVYQSDLTGEEGHATSTGNTPHDFVFNCTDGQIDFTLSQIINIFGQFNNNPLFNSGYSIPSHLIPSVSLRNQGMPFATPGAIAELNQVTLNSPSLLQFRPGSGWGPNRFLGAKLAGLAYGTLFSYPTRRPTMGCVPSSKWFVHEAGWHTPNGGMVLYEVVENFPGEKPGPTLPPSGNTVGAWHPRLWDLHVWRPQNPSANAVLEIDSPTYIPGIPLTSGTFFYPETFE